MNILYSPVFFSIELLDLLPNFLFEIHLDICLHGLGTLQTRNKICIALCVWNSQMVFPSTEIETKPRRLQHFMSDTKTRLRRGIKIEIGCLTLKSCSQAFTIVLLHVCFPLEWKGGHEGSQAVLCQGMWRKRCDPSSGGGQHPSFDDCTVKDKQTAVN